MATGNDTKILVAGIDFGTTYSGWAYSFRHQFKSNPVHVTSRTWNSGQLISPKAPTSVLIKADGKTLEAFGYDAETKYHDLAGKKPPQHKEYYYFRRFKMMLFDSKSLNRNVTLDDESGKKLAAQTVFSLAIKYLKDDMMGMATQTLLDNKMKPNEVQWVLTVPAIWNDAAKQFMREAAIEAGILSEHLTIALEPEAASLYCRHLPVDKNVTGERISLGSFKEKDTYMVVDAGGGTVDVTVHEVAEKGFLKEIFKANGGAWGGTMVDNKFLAFMDDIVGVEVMTAFRKDYAEDFVDLMCDFEIKKREIAPDRDMTINLRIPVALTETLKGKRNCSMEQAVAASKHAKQIDITAGRFKIEADIFKELFTRVANSIVNHVASLLRNPKLSACKAIVMVGGFSESSMLQKKIRDRFSSKLKVIIPSEAGLAVLKGAVIFGHCPDAISQRISKYTYGVSISEPFDPDVHPCSRKTNDGRCAGIFSTFVSAETCLVVGKAQNTGTYFPVNKHQESAPFDVYAAAGPAPKFVDENGCHKVAFYKVPLPPAADEDDKRLVSVKYIFGGTELYFEGTVESNGETFVIPVNFLG